MLANKRKVSIETLQEKMRAKQPTPAERLVVNVATARAARLQQRLEAAEREWCENPVQYRLEVQMEMIRASSNIPRSSRHIPLKTTDVICYCGGEHKYLPPDPILEAWWLRTQMKQPPQTILALDEEKAKVYSVVCGRGSQAGRWNHCWNPPVPQSG
jgi:hypothetical protein